MIALLITSFIILLSYILYAGVAESLSATYYKVKKEQKKQPTIEARVTDIEQVTSDVITALNEKGVIP